jgi:hypothetical protein
MAYANGRGGTVSFIRTRLYGAEASDNQRWANTHMDEMAARYPGKFVGISNGEVVIVAGTMESYKEKRAAWYEKKHEEGSSHHAVTSVPHRRAVTP